MAVVIPLPPRPCCMLVVAVAAAKALPDKVAGFTVLREAWAR